MKIQQLKEQLHALIDEIQNEAQLLDLVEIIQAQQKPALPYALNPEQLIAIEEGRSEFRAGLGIPNEQVMQEMEDWLSNPN